MHMSPSHAAQYLEKRLAPFCYQPYKFLVFIPFLVLSTNFFAMMIGLFITIGLAKIARKLPPYWARYNARVSLSKVEVIGRENIDPNQSYIIVANHNSHFDILAVYGWLGIDLRWVIKQELRKVPAIGYACEKLGHVFVDRSTRGSGMRSVSKVKEDIKGGTSIIFFPEGTRSADPELRKFKMGAFNLAKELDLPILPVTINGSGSILPPNTMNLIPGKMDLIVHEPISSTDKTAAELSNLSRQVIGSILEK